MSDLATVLLAALQSGPTTVVGAVALLSVGFALALYLGKQNVDSVTASSKATLEQIKSLRNEIAGLDSSLTTARKSIEALHKKNMELMESLREAKMQIEHLENTLRRNGIAVTPRPTEDQAV